MTASPVPGTDAPVQFDLACDLGAAPETVFDYVTDFPRLPEWMPLMRAVRVDDTNAREPGRVGAVRVISSGTGRETRETVLAWDRPALLAYGAADESLMGLYTGHVGVITLEPRAGGRTHLRWVTHAHPARSTVVRWIAHRMFDHVLRRSVAALEKRFP